MKLIKKIISTIKTFFLDSVLDENEFEDELKMYESFSNEQSITKIKKSFNYKNCRCYNCKKYTKNNVDLECDCGDYSFYLKEQCKPCPKNSFCDVPKNKNVYAICPNCHSKDIEWENGFVYQRCSNCFNSFKV